eukprot:TRINITY_DN1066_c0_g1_i15.p1 TRINITY_DN1066_c0_g1~~TRINITY_DN1066_c0_g1_i15.p1  ORF type:complete len:312 (+),score=59.78 TRINITY_DN1066_c0_g1_i15:392-1327(+)
MTHSSLKLASDSFSRKGYGNGFISTSDRFQIDNYQPYQVPGPGTYRQPQLILGGPKAEGTLFDPGKISEKYKSKYTSSFAKHDSKPRLNQQPALLGPGSYEISKDITDAQMYKSKAAFKSETLRFGSGRSASGLPGPGQYDVDKESVKRVVAKENPTCTSNFRVGVGAKRVKVNLYDPFENVENEEKRTPGPGQYLAEEPAKASLSKAHSQSSMFAQHEVLDRFGKPKKEFNSAFERVTPGPGQYHKDNIAKFKGENAHMILFGAEAAFKSEVKRGTYARRNKIPGPAFYKIRYVPIKESKNANPERGWLY